VVLRLKLLFHTYDFNAKGEVRKPFLGS